MGLSEPVQKPAEAEQIDLRTFGRPTIRPGTHTKISNPTSQLGAKLSLSKPSRPGEGPRKVERGEVAARKGGPGNRTLSGT